MAGVREGVAFYIFIGLLNVFVVSQFWQFANDLFTEAQGQRLFPMIASASRSAHGRCGLGAAQMMNFTYTLMFRGGWLDRRPYYDARG